MTTSLAADDAKRTGVDDGAAKLTDAGVRVVHLRGGASDETLYLIPGLESDPYELDALATAFIGPQSIFAIAPSPAMEQPPGAGMAHMAGIVMAEIRRLRPSGPYRLGGYSFGGLLALEVAQQLRDAGEEVAALFLIEAVYDERFWPRGIWARALARRTGRHLARIVRMRPTRAIGELGRRGGRLVQRLMRRRTDAHDPLPAASDASTMAGRAYAAITGYRPRFYDGTMVLIASSVNRQFGCDTVSLWSGYARCLQVERIEGDHLSVMQAPDSAVAIAGVIDHQLAVRRQQWAGLTPMPGFERPMIFTTMRWFAAARLAHALAEAGFLVSACRPSAHALEIVDGLTSDRRLRRTAQSRSLVAAIRAADPDIVLPDDERALVHLRRLNARFRHSDPKLAALVARSLGDEHRRSSITSRAGLAHEAQALGVSAPPTAKVATINSLRAWVAEHGLPMVLKTDGSWGGRGVMIVREAAQLKHAWRSVSSPPGLPRALKRLVVNLEAGTFLAWARRAKPVVNAQGFVAGREAIATVACLDGEVHQLVCLEVVQASEARGPATVVRVIEHPAMAEAARLLVRRLGLSGFCGFDFIINDAGAAMLVELNPRVTPTCHLLVEGDDLRGATIALFPAELARSGSPDSVVRARVDVPSRAPLLRRRGEEIAAKRRRPIPRLARRLKRKLTSSGTV
jgi:thioesterase domain-containing protein